MKMMKTNEKGINLQSKQIKQTQKKKRNKSPKEQKKKINKSLDDIDF